MKKQILLSAVLACISVFSAAENEHNKNPGTGDLPLYVQVGDLFYALGSPLVVGLQHNRETSGLPYLACRKMYKLLGNFIIPDYK